MKLGTTELILILVVALVVFGPSKLPELGKLCLLYTSDAADE